MKENKLLNFFGTFKNSSIENQIVCSQFVAQYILATSWKIIKQTK
jgi:hypothetical protein